MPWPIYLPCTLDPVTDTTWANNLAMCTSYLLYRDVLNFRWLEFYITSALVRLQRQVGTIVMSSCGTVLTGIGTKVVYRTLVQTTIVLTIHWEISCSSINVPLLFSDKAHKPSQKSSKDIDGATKMPANLSKSSDLSLNLVRSADHWRAVKYWWSIPVLH